MPTAQGSVKVVQVAALGGAEPPGCGSFSAGILPASEVSAASRASLRPAADKPAATRRLGPRHPRFDFDLALADRKSPA